MSDSYHIGQPSPDECDHRTWIYDACKRCGVSRFTLIDQRIDSQWYSLKRFAKIFVITQIVLAAGVILALVI